MSNFQCPECGMTNIDCGWGNFKTPRELELEARVKELLKENQQLRNSLSDSLMFKFTGQENETNRYRKALEEIEGYCNNVLSFTAVRTTESDILNIINKAKGRIDD